MSIYGSFLWHQRSKTPHRYHFVRLSVRLARFAFASTTRVPRNTGFHQPMILMELVHLRTYPVYPWHTYSTMQSDTVGSPNQKERWYRLVDIHPILTFPIKTGLSSKSPMRACHDRLHQYLFYTPISPRKADTQQCNLYFARHPPILGYGRKFIEAKADKVHALNYK